MYRPGDSWTEELGFSKDEFRTAFDKIGVRYPSKKAWLEAENKFVKDGKELFFCSYHDKIKGLTFYFRNDALIEKALSSLVNYHNPQPTFSNPEPETPVFVLDANPEPQQVISSVSLEIGNAEFRKLDLSIPNNTEITSEPTLNKNHISKTPDPSYSVCCEDEIKKLFTVTEQPAVKKQLAKIPQPQQFQVLAVITATLAAGNIKSNKIGYLVGLVKRVIDGTFTPLQVQETAKPRTAADRIQAEKEREKQREAEIKVDNVRFFKDLYKRLGRIELIPEPYWAFVLKV